jgi:hypothetical protein
MNANKSLRYCPDGGECPVIPLQEKVKALQKELAALACESVKRDIALAKLEAEVMAAIEAQNAQRWIPVAEGVPDIGQEVWICEHKRVFHIRWGCDMGFHPSHWMPYIMPQPPKGDD